MRGHAESPVPPPASTGAAAGDWGPKDWRASGTGSAYGGSDLPAALPGRPEPPDVPEAAEPAEPDAFAERPRGRGRRARGERQGREGRADRPDAAARTDPEPQDPAAQARALCLRLLTGSPRTRKQLADALHKRGIPEEIADEVLSRFEDVGLIDDAAFADAWVESRHNGRGLARRALARELRTRGVSGALADEAVARLDPEQETATARALVDRKLRSTRGLDRQVRVRRLAGMLARRGYSEGLALRVVREALAAEGEDGDGADGEELDQWLPEG